MDSAVQKLVLYLTKKLDILQKFEMVLHINLGKWF